jgi:hypothetical protein
MTWARGRIRGRPRGGGRVRDSVRFSGGSERWVGERRAETCRRAREQLGAAGRARFAGRDREWGGYESACRGSDRARKTTMWVKAGGRWRGDKNGGMKGWKKKYATRRLAEEGSGAPASTCCRSIPGPAARQAIETPFLLHACDGRRVGGERRPTRRTQTGTATEFSRGSRLNKGEKGETSGDVSCSRRAEGRATTEGRVA